MRSLLALMAVSTALAAAPALAQDEPPPLPPGPPASQADIASVPDIEGIHVREDRDASRIQHAVDAGDMTPGEAHRVREQLANIKTQEQELAQRDGADLNATDRQFINDRLNQLGHTIHWMRTEADWNW